MKEPYFVAGYKSLYHPILLGGTGLEPATPSVSSWCSNQSELAALTNYQQRSCTVYLPFLSIARWRLGGGVPRGPGWPEMNYHPSGALRTESGMTLSIDANGRNRQSLNMAKQTTSSIHISDEELLKISSANPNMRFELVEGELVTMTPVGGHT
jgi:hypothetical protein